MAVHLEGIDVGNLNAESVSSLAKSGMAKVHGEVPKPVAGFDAVRALIDLKTDPRLRTNQA